MEAFFWIGQTQMKAPAMFCPEMRGPQAKRSNEDGGIVFRTTDVLNNGSKAHKDSPWKKLWAMAGQEKKNVGGQKNFKKPVNPLVNSPCINYVLIIL